MDAIFARATRSSVDVVPPRSSFTVDLLVDGLIDVIEGVGFIRISISRTSVSPTFTSIMSFFLNSSPRSEARSIGSHRDRHDKIRKDKLCYFFSDPVPTSTGLLRISICPSPIGGEEARGSQRLEAFSATIAPAPSRRAPRHRARRGRVEMGLLRQLAAQARAMARGRRPMSSRQTRSRSQALDLIIGWTAGSAK